MHEQTHRRQKLSSRVLRIAALKCWKTLFIPNSENGRETRQVLMTCTLCEDSEDDICLRKSWTVMPTSLTAISTGYFISRPFQSTSSVRRWNSSTPKEGTFDLEVLMGVWATNQRPNSINFEVHTTLLIGSTTSLHFANSSHISKPRRQDRYMKNLKSLHFPSFAPHILPKPLIYQSTSTLSFFSLPSWQACFMIPTIHNFMNNVCPITRLVSVSALNWQEL
jgi:hypothetical protein